MNHDNQWSMLRVIRNQLQLKALSGIDVQIETDQLKDRLANCAV
jgi:hypothetical protein